MLAITTLDCLDMTITDYRFCVFKYSRIQNDTSTPLIVVIMLAEVRGNRGNGHRRQKKSISIQLKFSEELHNSRKKFIIKSLSLRVSNS